MHSSLIATITLCFVGARFVSSDTTKDPSEDMQLNQNSKITSKDITSTPDTWEVNPDLNSMWSHRPPSIQPQQPDNHMIVRAAAGAASRTLTRLAKSLSYGYDPYFDKGFFEPFERRQRPVTLVSFRKNGFVQRSQITNSPSNKGEDVAELQSPYNDIGNFWLEEPGPVYL